MGTTKKNNVFRISSEGDLEIAILHENQSAFTDIINPTLYTVQGEPPEQNILFHNDACFDLFLIHVAEVFAEGTNNVVLNGKNCNFSLFSGSLWLCKKYESETCEVGLNAACDMLKLWLDQTTPFEFWCGELDIQFKLIMSRRELISFAGNLSKHNVLRLNALMSKIQSLCKMNGFIIKDLNLVSVLEPFVAELKSRLEYHSSYLTEIMYDYFSAINRLVIKRFDLMKTNDVSKMKHPESVTSDSYRNLYGSTLVFRRYDENRFVKFRPQTTRFLKMRY
jgi:hypothetical protein